MTSIISIRRKISIILLSVTLLTVGGCATSNHVSQPPYASIIQPEHNRVVKDKSALYLPCDKPARITCQPLRLTDLTFLPNETLLSVNAGDTARWLFQTIVSSTDSLPVTHLLVKPKENNIKTNAVVATNQRTYYLNVIADEEALSNMHIGFYNPTMGTIEKTSCHRTMDNRYKITSGFFRKIPAWQPTRVYNDGASVYIEIPNLSQHAAPILYLLDEQNKPFIMNYQINKHTYRVDQLFTKAMLVKGVGLHRQSVTLQYLGHYSD